MTNEKNPIPELPVRNLPMFCKSCLVDTLISEAQAKNQTNKEVFEAYCSMVHRDYINPIKTLGLGPTYESIRNPDSKD